MHTRLAFRRLLFGVTIFGLAATATRAADAPAKPALDTQLQAYQRSIDRAVEYLRAKGQAADGSFSAPAGPGVTAIVTNGLVRVGVSPNDPLVAKSLKYMEGFVQPDGGVYQKETFYANYETCLAIVCFAAANRDGRYDKLLKKAEQFIKTAQWDEGESQDQSSPNYGGAGYGKHKRPDLSNTNFLVDALRAAGSGPDDPAMKKALIFVSRCQNLESEHNTTEFPAKNPDGGFYYTPAAGGASMAEKLPNGGLRSYGSMTYAGLKSMIYAGVGPQDARVKAAVAWLQKHYDVTSNPGLGATGLYYYYHIFAKALDAFGQDTFADEKGAKHDWRAELRTELIRRQQPNGSWLNDTTRWMEGDPNLVTGYALMSLAYCKPGVEKKTP